MQGLAPSQPCFQHWRVKRLFSAQCRLSGRSHTGSCAQQSVAPCAATRRSVLLLLPVLQFTFGGVAEASDGPPPAGSDEAPAGLIEELLKKSKANKETNDKSRFDSYYKRNLKDYFETEMRDPRIAAKKGLSPETIKSMQRYLEKNK
ncbi:hypothetical protein WJX73_006265 [Symbiochloris irregularis]|uniref:Uncharacterized protein n=1 Tax=Symbiochloris irregularis TaxID=706552 RepID=A0AAW1NTG1_9CHLO